jgi:hypothetical protein
MIWFRQRDAAAGRTESGQLELSWRKYNNSPLPTQLAGHFPRSPDAQAPM